jgi:hypothetical protein
MEREIDEIIKEVSSRLLTKKRDFLRKFDEYIIDY